MKLALQVFVYLFLLFGLLPVHIFLAPVLYILELTDEGQGICLTSPKPVFATTWEEGEGGLQCKKSNLAQYLLQAHSALVQKNNLAQESTHENSHGSSFLATHALFLCAWCPVIFFFSPEYTVVSWIAHARIRP
jgi:hypothetical protein